ncbi:MAG: hypothetical protein IKP66_04335 [Lachnospiraceae bacterium]|nr:hypothetical protein [Lachnospiraceae bacterium]
MNLYQYCISTKLADQPITTIAYAESPIKALDIAFPQPPYNKCKRYLQKVDKTQAYDVVIECVGCTSIVKNYYQVKYKEC